MEADVEELAKAIVQWLVKDKLAQITSGDRRGVEVIFKKNAMAAFAENACIFIHYFSTNTNNMVKESKKQTINVDNVLKVLSESPYGLHYIGNGDKWDYKVVDGGA